MNTPPTPLDNFFYKDVQDADGNTQPSRKIVQFIGATCEDDATNGRTVVTIDSAFGSPDEKSASYALQPTDWAIDFDTTSGNMTATMPSAPVAGRPYFLSVNAKGAAGHALTIAGNGNTINGSADYVLSTPYESVILIFTGTEYRVF